MKGEELIRSQKKRSCPVIRSCTFGRKCVRRRTCDTCYSAHLHHHSSYVRTCECVLLFSPSLFHFQFIWPTRKTATGNSSAFATGEVGGVVCRRIKFRSFEHFHHFFFCSVSIQWRKTYRKEKRLGFHFELERNWRQMLSPNKIKIFFSKLLLPKMEISLFK